MADIHFFADNTSFVLSDSVAISQWLTRVLLENKTSPSNLNFIFTTDQDLLEINKQYLQNNIYTDNITFQYSEPAQPIEADIYISVDRVQENAGTAGLTFRDELHRVMVHGILHLLGHKDKTLRQKENMLKLENHYLALRKFTY